MYLIAGFVLILAGSLSSSARAATAAEAGECDDTVMCCACVYEDYAGCAEAATPAACAAAVHPGDCVWNSTSADDPGSCVSFNKAYCERFYDGDSECYNVVAVSYADGLPVLTADEEDLECNVFRYDYFGHSGGAHRVPTMLTNLGNMLSAADAAGRTVCGTYYNDHGCEAFISVGTGNDTVTPQIDAFGQQLPPGVWAVIGANRECSYPFDEYDDDGVLIGITWPDAGPTTIEVVGPPEETLELEEPAWSTDAGPICPVE